MFEVVNIYLSLIYNLNQEILLNDKKDQIFNDEISKFIVYLILIFGKLT